MLDILRKHLIESSRVEAVVDYILDNKGIATPAFKKYKRYVEAWKPVKFTANELKFLRGIPGIKPVTASILYHGKNVPLTKAKKYQKDVIITYSPKAQFSSWTTKKSNTTYFQRGPGVGIVLKAKTPAANRLFNVHGLMHPILDRLYTWVMNHMYDIKAEDLSLLSMIIDTMLYNENEVWVFGPINATVLSVDM